MTIHLTPEQSESVQWLVQTGAYRDEVEVIDEALALLKRQLELHAQVTAGIHQLDRGQYTTYQPHERERLLDEVEAASRALAVEIQRGIDDIAEGRYRDYSEDEFDTLMSDIAKRDEQRDL